MSATTVLTYVFAAGCIVSSLYVALSRDLLRVTLAFFIELSCVGGILLSLNADYLALTVFAVGLMGTVLVITFSSVILGGLKVSFRREEQDLVEQGRRGRSLARLLGMLLGLGVGAAVSWAFLTAPFIDSLKVPEPARDITDVVLLGRMLLGEQAAVFVILGVMILVVVVGSALLLRKPSDAN